MTPCGIGLTLRELLGCPPTLKLLLKISEVKNFPTGNFVSFLELNTELGESKKFQTLQLGSRDMTIFGEWACITCQNVTLMPITFGTLAQLQ